MFNLGKFATLGRNEDDTLAHVATGEMVVRPEVLGPKLTNQIKDTMKGFGLDPARYTVGSGANSLNPVTGQPEFFLSGLFGSSGTGKYLKELQNKYLPQIENLDYSTQGITSPFGSVNYTDDGIQVTPSGDIAATSEMFKNLGSDYLKRLQESPEEAELRAAYEMFAPTMDRQQLQDMFTAGIQPQEEMIDMQTDSALSRILGGRGISTGSASAMGAAQRQADLAKQQLRIGAFQGAQQAGYNDLNALQNMLTGTQGFRSNNLQNLFGATNAQYAPFANLMNMISPSMMYNQNLTNFDMGKIGAAIDLENQYAQYKTNPKGGFLQNAILPTISAFTGGGMSMPNFGGNTNTTGGTYNANAMGFGGSSNGSSLYQPSSY
jgi:hypothetical protein